MGIVSQCRRNQVINFLKHSDPDRLLKIGQRKLIPVFQEAAKTVPAYRKMLAEKGINFAGVKDTESFKKQVPIIDKSIFSVYGIAELCREGTIKKAKQFSLSSGFSGVFSYGLSTKKELSGLSFFADLILECNFNISKKKTFWISCIGMGVKVYTDLPLAETSVRSDMVLALVKKIGMHFDQIIIIGNPYFVKKIIEDGIYEGIDWKAKPVHLIIGEDWFPENFRTYLAHIMGIDLNHPEKGVILSSMGICEIGISIFHEFKELMRIRRLAQEDEKLRTALFGENTEICPLLFFYHPYLTFLEDIDEELIFTTLSQDTLIPLIRYNSHDKGRVYTYNEVKALLMSLNHQDYIPEFKLPLVSVMGRKRKSIDLEKCSVTPEEVKSGIYSDFEVAAATTGYFRMSKRSNHLFLEVQLKEGRQCTQDLQKKFFEAIVKYVKTDFQLQLYPYKEFPYGIGLIYEQKFRYI